MIGLTLGTSLHARPFAAACDTPQRTRLDFMIGEWNVVSESGAAVAQTSIVKILEGCAVEQSWIANDGLRARGVFFYFDRTDRWHLTWIETRGMLLRLDGRERGAELVFSGEAPGRNRQKVRHEFAISRLADGRLRQAWRQSTDGGATWPVAFTFIYRPRSSS